MGLWEDLFDRARSFFGETSEETRIQKRCYYELLEVPRDATEDDIKRSYKKLALKWHPDKNPERKDECTAYFILLQQAYEVLTDPQERAFYDKHRENIIQGSSPEEKRDTGINLYPFFQKCYYGYEDDENGFFSIYRQLFDTLASEEFPYIEDDEDKDFPSFGTSTSDYDQVVAPFYDLWTSFSTQRSFAWLDKYDLRHAEDRYTIKCMDKENKKLRDEGRRKRNEEIRNLALYIRRRDPRVKAYREQLEDRKKKEFERVEQQRKEQIIRNLRNFEQEDGRKHMNDEYFDELDRLETELDEQFGVFGVDGEENLDSYYCIVCEKNFKTSKAFTKHNSSNKHRQAVEELKNFMQDEDKCLNEHSAGERGADDEERAVDDEEKVLKKATKKKRVKAKNKTNDIIEDDSPSISGDDVEEDKDLPQKNKRTGDRRKQIGEKKPTTQSTATSAIESSCMICKETFPSKTKLFEHIRATGHAALKEVVTKATKKKKR